jgi:hypothetical protein
MGTKGVEKIKAADVITKLSASILKIIERTRCKISEPK